MGAGAIIIGHSAAAFVWTIVAFLVIYGFLRLGNRPRLGAIRWALAIALASFAQGTAMYLIPAYESSRVDSAISILRIFVVPAACLLLFAMLLRPSAKD